MDRVYLANFLSHELNIKVNDDILDKFKKYEEYLVEYNKKFNLTAIVDEEGILEKHFIDSTMAMKFVDFTAKSLCDIGTGAGFPGIVLAILNPSLNVTLVESNNKKVSFLNILKDELCLDNVKVICTRAEDLKDYREHFDYVTARAVTQLNVLLELGVPLLKVNGILIAYKLADNLEELKGASKAIDILECALVDNKKFNLPISNSPRSIILIKKKAKTPLKYPRPFNQISKKSL